MKNHAKRFALICLALALLVGGTLSVSASKYVKAVVSEEFDTAADCEFLAPGDMNADGAVNAADSVELRKLLLSKLGNGDYADVYAEKGSSAMYSDVNGDDLVNLKDLVRQKKNMAENFVFISDGAMTLNGNSAFSGEVISVLGSGATYEISYSYKSEAPIKVKVNGLDGEIVYESDAASALTSATHTLKTPLSIEDATGIELQIIGVGTVENFSVTRVNMDNELVENW